MLHDLMTRRVSGPRIYLNVYNFTNAEEFMSGKDEKIKLAEVGPFVYQEYRLNYNLRIDTDAEVMSYTPQLWTKFIPEESIADPKTVHVMMPSLAMLMGTDMMSNYPFLVRSMFNTLANNLHSEPIINITAHEFFWGYPDPLLKFSNNLIPGLFYDSVGTLERVYDYKTNYTLEIGIEDEEKFSIKKVKKHVYKQLQESDNLAERTQTFSNSYEGAVFPPALTPETPIYIYRHGVCKVFKIQYTGTKTTEYGSEGFVYDIANETFNDHQLCDSKGWCPDGLLSVAPCYKNFQVGVSRGHFLGADPRLLKRFEGIKPDKKLHSTEIIIDPKIGVTLYASISLQANLVLGDIAYSSKAKRLKDTVLPLYNIILKSPELPPQAQFAIGLMYIYGPYILLAIKIICVILGLGLLAYSIRILITRVIGSTSVTDLPLQSNTTNGYMPVNLLT